MSFVLSSSLLLCIIYFSLVVFKFIIIVEQCSFFDNLLCVSISCHYWFSFIICICNTQNTTYTVHTVHVLAVIGSAQCANSQRISSDVLSYRERENKKQILNRELAMIFAFAFLRYCDLKAFMSVLIRTTFIFHIRMF